MCLSLCKRGEFAAVVGESGSGKSTLLNCIGGLDVPTSVKIYLDKEDLFSMDETKRTIYRRQNIGFIFQSFHLISELNVEQNIIFPLLLDHQKPDKEQVNEILACLDSSTAGTIFPVSYPAASSSGWLSAGPLSQGPP